MAERIPCINNVIRQALHAAHDFTLAAKQDIDAIYGVEGYAEAHPELVFEYMKMSGLAIVQAIQEFDAKKKKPADA